MAKIEIKEVYPMWHPPVSHEETHGSFRSPSGGEAIYYRQFKPKQVISGEQQVGLVFLPDFLDYHLGQQDLIEYVLKKAPRNLVLGQMDWKGLGMSGGPRASVSSMSDYLADLDYYLGHFFYPMNFSNGVFIGQGFGGTLALQYLLQKSQDARDWGAILVNPWVAPTMALPRGQERFIKLKKRLPVMGKIKFKLPFELSSWTQNVDRIRELGSDPLVPKELGLGLVTGIKELADQVRVQAYFLDHPCLFILGKENPLNDQRLSLLFAKGIPNHDTEIQQVESKCHDLLHGEVAPVVFEKVFTWIQNHCLRK